MTFRLVIAGLALFCTPAMALAADGVPVSEASSALLFALGALGVLIGRQASRRRATKPPRPRED